MQFALRHWSNFGAIVAGAALILLLCGSPGMGFLQRVLLANFIIQLIQQCEQHGWFGRELAMKDMVLPSSVDAPLNPKSTIIFNLLVAYGLYLAPVVFPDVIWLGLASMLFGFMRFVVPVATNRKLLAIYPHRRTALVLGQVSIGLVYLYYIHANHLVTAWNWAFAFLFMLGWQYVALVRVVCGWLTDQSSPYPFSDDWNA